VVQEQKPTQNRSDDETMTSHPPDDERIFHIARGIPDPELR
jgi:hypothetical protein